MRSFMRLKDKNPAISKQNPRLKEKLNIADWPEER
jgi:hypothetical protein